MIIKKISVKMKYLLVLLLITTASVSFAENKKGGPEPKTTQGGRLQKTAVSGKGSDSYRFSINNINLPLDSRGVTAAVNIGGRSGAEFGGKKVFLFSGGFMLSGYTNGQLWANAQATASLIENYEPGPAGMSYDPRAVMYIVNAQDKPFSKSWTDWSDAVALGADFYDGDGNGSYNPVDLNGNGKWDTNEDMPDLLGDETVWCVYNDGVPAGQRTRFSGIDPQGIEVRQTVFGFASRGAIGNIVFIRYRLRNTGLKADTLRNVYFGVWADPDLGEPTDDFVGCDVPRNAGFVYGKGPDKTYGTNPPCFLIDFFSGPVAYLKDSTYTDVNGNNVYDAGVDISLDTAYSVRGQQIGVVAFPGATNLGMSSFVHYQQGSPPIQDPNSHTEARYYMLGLDQYGKKLDPCNWELGTVKGVDCATVDDRFWYSGDPVTGQGWVNSKAQDQRQMQNTGPFDMVKGKDIEIVVAYVVGQGKDAISSVSEAKRIDDGAQFIFDSNFQTASPPPQPQVNVTTLDDRIELSWDTPEQVNYSKKTQLYDMRFEGYNVYAFRTNSVETTVGGLENIKLVQTYDLKNFISDIYKEDNDGVPRNIFPKNVNGQLDAKVFADPSTGRIKFVIEEDPFTGGPLIKGRPYMFAVTSYAVNHLALKNMTDGQAYGSTDNYNMSNKNLFAEAENVFKIISVTTGENTYDLAAYDVAAGRTSGGSKGKVSYEIVDKNAITGDKYEVSFIPDSAKTGSAVPEYSAYWRLTNVTKNQVLLDSMKQYFYGTDRLDVPVTDGLVVKVSEEKPELGRLKYQTSADWIDTVATKFYYLAEDLPGQGAPIAQIGIGNTLHTLRNKVVRADKLRNVEIRFDQKGKAYRYLNGYYGANARAKNGSFAYAEAVTQADTAGKGVVGKLGEGYVEVPFTAWVEDPQFGEKRQLAVGFIERAASLGGKPDGNWDPDSSLTFTGEYILVFDATYDPAGNQQVYKGYTETNGTKVWADLNAGNYYKISATAPLTVQEKAIAASPFFNTIYALGVKKKTKDATWSEKDKLVIPVKSYPYTSLDKFTFVTNASGKLAEDAEKSIYDRANVYPNPLFAYNIATSYTSGAPDETFVTFSNLPEEITVKIFSLSGQLIRTLTTADKTSPTSPFLRWDLQNETGLRVASGMYLAVIHSPKYGDKVLKFAIIMPQKQLPKY